MTRLVALALALAGCHAAPDTRGTVTADEDARLNAAAATLDANTMGADTPANGDAP